MLRIHKPWGWDQIMYTGQVEVKELFIKQGHCTSLHCHPKKKTGLCVLKGLVKVDFLNNSFWLEPGDKLMIRPGVFHRSNAKLDSQLLEIENPIDKDDLVRLDDKYGREQGYETLTEELRLPTFNFNTIDYGEVGATHGYYCGLNGKYLILSGGIYNIYDDKKVYVLGPGDLVDNDVIHNLCQKFIQEEMEVIHVFHI